MTLMSRLFADTRRARRLRAARAEIRRAEKSLIKRGVLSGPGYDELSDPVFLAVIVLAFIVLAADVRGDLGSSIVVDWCRAAVEYFRGLA